MQRIVLGNARVRCALEPESDLIRIEPAGSAVWECRLVGELRAAPKPEDSKWEYPRPYDPGWAGGRSRLLSLRSQGTDGAVAEVLTPAGPARLSIALDPDRPAVRFAVEAAPGTPAPLSWPGPLRPAEGQKVQQRLFLPYCQGFVFAPGHAEGCRPLAVQVRYGPGVGLPFVGLISGRSGWLLTFETADDAVVELAKPEGQAIEVRPVWLSSMGALGYRRSLRYEFAPEATGTRLAKMHRAAVRGGPTRKTLAEKAEQRPLLNRLAGAAYLFTGYYGFEKADRRLTDLCRRLLDETGYPGLLAGPLEMCGYRDGEMSFVGAEPCISAPGTREFLRSRGLPWFNYILDKGAEARLKGFDRDHLLLQADGTPWMSWVSEHNKLVELCPLRVEPARAALLDGWCAGAPVHHVDTATMTGLLECRHPAHPCTRGQDRAARAACLSRFLDSGHVVVSEAGQDWAVPVADLLSLNNFGHHITNSDSGWRPVPFPLFALVYRECVGSFWHEADTWHDGRGEDKLLYDAALGNAPTLAPLIRLFRLVAGRPVEKGEEFFSRDETTGAGWNLCARGAALARLHAATWQEEMVSFEYLDGEGLLSRTELAGGTAILVNRGSEPAKDDGRTVPPRALTVIR